MSTKADQQHGLQILSSELASLNPSAIITMFEIDVSSIAFDLGVTVPQEPFRFHNTISLLSTNIYWKGDTYVGAPINADGFDLNMKGTLSYPKLSITTSDLGIPALAQLKAVLRQLGDLIGAKVTRRRTLAKYLDNTNFATPNGAQPLDPSIGFSEDPTVEFPEDVYFITRKSNENKYVIEYELGSIIDVSGLQLPNRLVSVKRCMWQYRGEGCYYEYRNRYNANIMNGANPNVLPEQAPPVANTLDKKITDILGTTVTVGSPQPFNVNQAYKIGDCVYLTKDGLNYYYVASAPSQGNVPPDTNFWIEDQCSKTTFGCRLRWLTGNNTFLPFGGFPTVGKYA